MLSEISHVAMGNVVRDRDVIEEQLKFSDDGNPLEPVLPKEPDEPDKEVWLQELIKKYPILLGGLAH